MEVPPACEGEKGVVVPLIPREEAGGRYGDTSYKIQRGLRALGGGIVIPREAGPLRQMSVQVSHYLLAYAHLTHAGVSSYLTL